MSIKRERRREFDRKDSQDVWVFNGLVKANIGDYYLGIAGCDNKLAFELKTARYTVLNPSKTIHAIHLHSSNYRTYDPKKTVPQPYHFIFPHKL